MTRNFRKLLAEDTGMAIMPGMHTSGKSTGLQPRVADNYEAMSQLACDFIVAEIKKYPNLLLCASAGASPIRTYQLLAGQHAKRPGLFDQMRVLKIDEWGGIAMDNSGSCEVCLQTHLVRPLGISPERYQAFNSQAADFKAECQRIEYWHRVHGPIDVCVLGLGTNGHIALNEPAADLEPHAHPARLTEESMAHPMLHTSAQKPVCGLTLGMADILQSRRILLLVNGSRKREPLKRLLEPVISTQFPGSFLWLHPDVTVLCDHEAI